MVHICIGRQSKGEHRFDTTLGYIVGPRPSVTIVRLCLISSFKERNTFTNVLGVLRFLQTLLVKLFLEQLFQELELLKNFFLSFSFSKKQN